MKKTWVALAVAGAFVAGAAQAQSSVTLYGILDVNYMWQDRPTNVGTATAPKWQLESVSAINGGHQFGNRWGLRGSEDLGGGLKAIFQLESGFNIDTGTMGQDNATNAQGTAAVSTASGRLFGRQAYVGLGSNWGTVVAGRIATFSSGTGAFDMFSTVDPFGTGFGLASLGQTFISANSLRLDNTIAYVSPKFAGFTGGIGYSTNINGSEVTPSGGNATAFASGINWSYGPFYAVVTYDVVNAPDAAAGQASRPDQKHLQIGGTWTIGPFKLAAAWADQTNVSALAGPGGPGSFLVLPAGLYYDNNAYMLGATWNIGAFSVFGSWQSSAADGKTYQTAAGPKNFEPDYDVYGIGATYAFSPRTNLYASYASRDANGTLIGNEFNAKQFAVGMAHKF
jgi:predicted porin